MLTTGVQQTTIPHGNAGLSPAFVRTNPTSLDVVKEKLKDKTKKPREIFAEM